MDLDKKDKILLELLYQDSRKPLTALGKKLKLTGPAIEKRIQKYFQSGIIVSMMANVNFSKLGLNSYKLFFKFDSMNSQTEKQLVKLLNDYPSTIWAVTCEGDYDAIWRIGARDPNEVDQAIGKMLQLFGPKIVDKSISTVINQAYMPWNKAFGFERSKPNPIEKASPVEITDPTDLMILSMLYSNARERTVDIAKKVGLSPEAVSYRIRNLVKRDYLRGFTCWFSGNSLGFNYHKLLLRFKNITQKEQDRFWKYCAMNDSVIYLVKTLGQWDMEVDIIVRNNRELHEFSKELKEKFEHMIGNHTTVSVIDEWMPNPMRSLVGKG